MKVTIVEKILGVTVLTGVLCLSSLYLNENISNVKASNTEEVKKQIELKKEDNRVQEIKSKKGEAEVNYVVQNNLNSENLKVLKTLDNKSDKETVQEIKTGAEAVREADYNGEAYLLIQENNQEVGWVKKEDVSVELKKQSTTTTSSEKENTTTTTTTEKPKNSDITIQKEEEVTGYFKINNRDDVYTAPKGLKDSKKVTLTKEEYIVGVTKVTLSNSEEWIKGRDNNYYKLSELTDVTNEFIDVATSDKTVEDISNLSGRTLEELNSLNMGMDRNDVVPKYIVINLGVKLIDIESKTTNMDVIALVGYISHYKNYIKEHNLLPSVVAGQAILESSGGNSQLATQDNNLFGIKADSKWLGERTAWATTEFGGSGYYGTTSDFRRYGSLGDSIKDYVDFLEKNSRYSAVFGQPDYVSALTEISNAGYATDPSYVTKVATQIETYGLNALDN